MNEMTILKATDIQRVFKGFQVRRDLLPCSLFPLYKAACEQVNASTPRAQAGKTLVYLPLDLPGVVLKLSGRTVAKERFYKTQVMKDIIRSQGYKSLLIPRMHLCGEFLVEERLLIDIDPQYNAMLYLTNKELFDDPVREMTRFFGHAYIDYLVEKNSEDDSILRVRYDNIPFLLEEKEGQKSIKLAFLDLERSTSNPDFKKARHKFYILVSMFPLHVDLIEEEAKNWSVLVPEEEIIKIRGSSLCYAKEYLTKNSEEYLLSTQAVTSSILSSSAPQQNYVTYESRPRRFGDDLINYLHAKWIAYRHKMPLLYKPFMYSSELKLDDLESQYNQKNHTEFKEVRFRKGLEVGSMSEDLSKIYLVRYFPECSWEKTHGTRHNGKPWVDYFDIDWSDVEFRKMVQALISPKQELFLVVPPQDCMSIAVHYREGGGYDQNISSLNLPTKFPPLDFYIQGLLKMNKLFEGRTLYCYLFTDAKNPVEAIDQIKAAMPLNSSITFDCRSSGNSHDKNVLEDFFSLFQFDCLIYPQSNFSMVPALIHDYVATYTIVSTQETRLDFDEEALKRKFNR
jgi:hypothetical protein